MPDRNSSRLFLPAHIRAPLLLLGWHKPWVASILSLHKRIQAVPSHHDFRRPELNERQRAFPVHQIKIADIESERFLVPFDEQIEAGPHLAGQTLIVHTLRDGPAIAASTFCRTLYSAGV